MQSPIIKELMDKYGDKVTFKVIDVDEDQTLAHAYSVHAIPTIIILNDGKMVNSFVGLTSKEKLETEIAKYI
ncbi:MAG: thioredoxin family protein [Methanimicrococcus sp.]|nr:thioredoxin family protein [Methanimicrococcus sp.]